MYSLIQLLPLGIVMVVGPQIASALLLVTSERPLKNSVAFVCGAVGATTLVTAIFYWLGNLLNIQAHTSERSGSTLLNWVFVVLMVVVAISIFRNRHESEPPVWMSKLQTLAPKSAFLLGFLLFAIMPTDIILTFTVGVYVASKDLPFWSVSGFIIVTAFLISLPLQMLLLMGKRADTLLPKIRNWMKQKSWIISEIILGLFLVLQLQSIFS